MKSGRFEEKQDNKTSTVIFTFIGDIYFINMSNAILLCLQSISSQFDDLRISEGSVDSRGNVTYKRSFSSGNDKTISQFHFNESSPICSASRRNLFFRSKSMPDPKSQSSPAIVMNDKKITATKKSTGRFTVRPAQLVRFEITKISEESANELQKQHSTEEPSASVSAPLL